ncbi:MAG: hypothetical protein ACK5B9_09470 [Flavobacteriia bacterium]|jgi:hypothetical protein
MKLKIIYLSVFLVLIFLLFFGLGDQIMFAKNGFQRWTPFFLIFLGAPVFLFLFLKQVNASKNLINKVVPLSILFLGISFGLRSKYISENDFKENGKMITGVVCDKFKKANSKGVSHKWNIVGKFSYQNKIYFTFSKSLGNMNYEIGDRVQIRFSTRNPENNELLIW